MSAQSPVLEERRRFVRASGSPSFDVSMVRPHGSIAADQVNFSEGGLCVRTEEALEVRSLVRLQLTPGKAEVTRGQRSLACTGRVAWVIQRLDLRNIPPFLFDIGIEFVDPPRLLRELIARHGSNHAAIRPRQVRQKALESTVIRGRMYLPRVTRESGHRLRWHLVIAVDGAPCFSGHYASERSAAAAWTRFRRQQAQR